MSSDGTKRPRAVATSNLFFHETPSGVIGEWCDSLDRSFNLDGYHVVEKGSCGVGWAEPEVEPLVPIEPGSHRSGTCFENESREMRAACVEPIRTYLGADVVLHEVRHQQAGYHTDLVYATVDVDGLRKRNILTHGQDPLHDPLQRFKVWWYLVARGPLPRSDAVENGCYADASKNRKHIDWCLENGYAARTATDHLVGVVPPEIAELHAVELKLRDWQTALDQADRANRCDLPEWSPQRIRDCYGYADYRWVALDAGAVNAALANREQFEERGVGLLGIAEGGTVVEHVDAAHEPRGRYTRDRAYAESQVWERVDLSERLGPARSKRTTTSEGSGTQPSLAAFDGGEAR